MKNRTPAVAVALGLAIAVISLIAFFFIRTQRCRRRYDRCVDDCDQTRDQALGERLPLRSALEIERRRKLNECRLLHLNDGPAAIQACQDSVNAESDADLARLDALDAPIHAAHERCVAACRQAAGECEDELQVLGRGVPRGPQP